MSKEYRRYDDELKEAAVRMHMQERLSLHRVARELGVSDASVIRKWVRAKQMYGDDWLRERRGRPRMAVTDLSVGPVLKRRMTIHQARERIKQLETENEQLLEQLSAPRGGETEGAGVYVPLFTQSVSAEV